MAHRLRCQNSVENVQSRVLILASAIYQSFSFLGAVGQRFDSHLQHCPCIQYANCFYICPLKLLCQSMEDKRRNYVVLSCSKVMQVNAPLIYGAIEQLEKEAEVWRGTFCEKVTF